MSTELKPCPFCGEAEELYPSFYGLGAGKPYGIDCIGCGIDFTPREGMDVIAAWNRRAIPNELLEAVQNAKGFLDTPISRRRNAGDSFYSEAVKSINDALAKVTP